VLPATESAKTKAATYGVAAQQQKLTPARRFETLPPEMDAQMRNHGLSFASGFLGRALVILACAESPKLDTWIVPPDAGTAPESSPVVIHGQLKSRGNPTSGSGGSAHPAQRCQQHVAQLESEPFAESKPALAYMRGQLETVGNPRLHGDRCI